MTKNRPLTRPILLLPPLVLNIPDLLDQTNDGEDPPAENANANAVAPRGELSLHPLPVPDEQIPKSHIEPSCHDRPGEYSDVQPVVLVVAGVAGGVVVVVVVAVVVAVAAAAVLSAP